MMLPLLLPKLPRWLVRPRALQLRHLWARPPRVRGREQPFYPGALIIHPISGPPRTQCGMRTKKMHAWVGWWWWCASGACALPAPDAKETRICAA